MENIELAKKLLVEEDLSCILVGNDRVIKSKDKGVKPLIDIIKNQEDVKGYSVADTVVGKAAALLYVYIKVGNVFGRIMSQDAINVFKENNIEYSYLTLVPYIKNRDKTDMCPMEKSVRDINDPNLGYQAILEKIKELMKSRFA